MNLANLKQSFDKVASAAGVEYDSQAMETVSDKVQEFVSNGKSFGKKLVDFIKKDKTDEDSATLREELQSHLPSEALTGKDTNTEEARLLEQIRQDVDIQIDAENKEVIIDSGALTDETTDALRKYLALKGETDEAWKTPDLTVGKDVTFESSYDESQSVVNFDHRRDFLSDSYPDFAGMNFGKLEIQSQNITNGNYMFAGVSADEIVVADQPNLESADNMFSFAQADNISIGKIPDNIDVSFDLMRDCPSDVTVAGTLYEVSEATRADIEEKMERSVEDMPTLGDTFPGILPRESNKIPKEPVDAADRDLQDATTEADKTAVRSAMAGYELGIDTQTEMTEESSVGLEK